MDKELIEGLSNLSSSLDKISEALKSGKSKSATGSALQMGDFDKQIREISSSITEIKKDTQKLLDQQDTILKILKDKNESKVSGDKSKKVLSGKSTTTDVAREKSEEKEAKKIGGLDTSKIKDGVSSVLIIATGIIAIGLALKIVGKIDFLSVIGLAIALPLIAIAFSKIAAAFAGQDVEDNKGRKIKTNKINTRDLPGIVLGMVGFSTAIMASSWILSKVKPIGLFQAVTSILIAGAFAVMAPNLGKLIRAFNKVGFLDALKASFFLPIVLLGVSTAIMLSSHVLSKVKPIGLFQAITAILIAGTFAVIGQGLGKLLSAFKGINPMTALLASAVMPVVLLAVSISIALSSYFLSKVRPIGFFQALTAIMIAATFSVMAFGIGKIISAFRRIDPLTALAAAAMMPILFVALSISIMASSYFLSKVTPIGLFQALTSILISAVFVVLSFGVAKIMRSFRGISPMDITKAVVAMPLIFTALSIAIMASSVFLSKVRPIGLFQFLTSVGISLLFIVFAYSMKLVVNAVKNINPKDAVMAGLMMIGWTTVVAIAGFIISKMPDISLGKIVKFTLLSLALVGTTVIIALSIKLLSKISLSDIIKGGLVIVAIATVIAISSLILNIGKYDKYPSLKWALGVGLTMVAFGMAALVIGTLITATAGLGAIAIGAGLLAVLAIAGTIVATDKIISTGSYNKYPGLKWALGVGGTLVGFAAAVVTLGVINSVGGIASTLSFGIVKNPIDAGVDAVIKIAKLIPIVDKIISTGSYSKYPGLKWSLGVGGTMTAFATAVVVLGALNSGGGLLQKLTLGAVKNPIDSGIDAVKKIAGAIVDVDKILSNGKYTGGPNANWSKGISLALGAFSPVYSMLMKEKVMSIFGKGISTKDFAEAIKTISQGIVDSATLFGKAKVSFQNGPPVSWATGVSKALGAFSPIYTLLLKNSGWFKSGVSPKQFAEAIRTISQGIVDAANYFGKAKVAFQNGPPVVWADGVSKALGAFSPIYTLLLKNSGWFKSGVSPKQFAEAIRTISQGIVDSANLFGKSKASFQNGPPVVWADGVSKALSAFFPIYTLLLKNSGWFKSGVSPKDYAEAIKTISQGIVDSANLFGKAKASFQNGPPVAWADGVGKALGAFSPIYTLLLNNSGWFKSGVSPKQFAEAIKTISQGIVDAANVFSRAKASFLNPPPIKWAEGVGKALGVFSPIYTLLLKNSGWFKSGVNPKQFADAIRTISQGIVDAANVLSKNKASFSNYPSLKWSEGVSKALQAFTPIFEHLNKNKSILGSIFGSDPSKDMSKAIISISDTLVKVSFILSKGRFDKSIISDSFINGVNKSINLVLSSISRTKNIKLDDTSKLFVLANTISDLSYRFSRSNFNKYPTDKWTSAVQKSINDFSNLISKTKISVSGVNSLKLIVDTILFTDKRLSTGKYQKWPVDIWLKKSTSAIKTYGDMMVKVDKEYPLRGLQLGIFKSKSIVDFLLWVDRKLATGKYQKWPDKPWLPKSVDSILKYGRLAIQADKEFPWIKLVSGMNKVTYITKNILWVDSTLDKGKYKKWPEKIWLDKTSNSILRFGQLALDVDKRFGFIQLYLGLRKSQSIANTIRDISLSLDKGKYTKFPSLEWAKGVPRAIGEFMKLPFKGVFGQILDSLIGASEDSKKSQLGKIVDLMLYVDKKLQSGDWKKFPTVNWVNGTILAIQKFRQMISLLSFSSLGDKILQTFGFKNPLVTALSNIDKLALSFDKLGKSVKTFTDSIKNIDAEKLSAIKGLSSNVIMLSLMDPTQFDSMMTKLEERSGVFADLLKDFESKKNETAKTGGGSGGVTFKPAAAAPAQKTDSQILAEKIDLMNALLSDISSVVGSRGALKNYLNKMKDDITIGGTSNSLNQRSDSRLKNIIKKLYVSDSGINVYLFSYKFDPNVVYQGIIAQELLGTPYESALHIDKNGLYSVDYSKIDVEFKRTNSI